jgi:hypothetical protein
MKSLLRPAYTLLFTLSVNMLITHLAACHAGFSPDCGTNLHGAKGRGGEHGEACACARSVGDGRTGPTVERGAHWGEVCGDICAGASPSSICIVNCSLSLIKLDCQIGTGKFWHHWGLD